MTDIAATMGCDSLNEFDQIIKHYGNKIKHVYFNFDAYNNNQELKRQSIFICRINKNF